MTLQRVLTPALFIGSLAVAACGGASAASPTTSEAPAPVTTAKPTTTTATTAKPSCTDGEIRESEKCVYGSWRPHNRPTTAAPTQEQLMQNIYDLKVADPEVQATMDLLCTGLRLGLPDTIATVNGSDTMTRDLLAMHCPDVEIPDPNAPTTTAAPAAPGIPLPAKRYLVGMEVGQIAPGRYRVELPNAETVACTTYDASGDLLDIDQAEGFALCEVGADAYAVEFESYGEGNIVLYRLS